MLILQGLLGPAWLSGRKYSLALQAGTLRANVCTTACHSGACRVLAAVEEPHALVLERVAGQPLAQKPNLQVLLRCRWAPDLEFRAAWIAGVAHGVASALAYLHAHCICHGGCCRSRRQAQALRALS